MRTSPYYSVRTGKHPTGGRLNFDMFRRQLLGLYQEFEERGHFQEALGYHCVDSGYVEGQAGPKPEQFVFRKLRKEHLWPIGHNAESLSEDDLFDLVEFLYDHASKGVDGGYHQYCECGWHYRTFDRSTGRNEFRAAVNELLRDYASGYELLVDGELVEVAPRGLAELIETSLPQADLANVGSRVQQAISKFRRRGASSSERRDAIRDLADVLEYLRPSAKAVLTKKDEAELFDLANNFGIRHHNQRQRTDYDPAIWLSWMFHYYLATIHALTRLIERDSAVSSRDAG
jgi:hypothetical protein